MNLRVFSYALIMSLAAGCSSPAGQGSTSSVPPLTADEVNDAQVSLTTLTGSAPLTYQLTDGTYQKGTDPAGASFVSIRLLDQMAFGDLNGDGAGDAAALVAENYGGTGTFVSLVVFVNQKGVPAQKAITPVDDRPIIRALTLENGSIGLEATIHGLQDPMCCPTLQSRRHYRLVGDQLVLRDFSTQVASGGWRSITVTQPEDGEAGGSSLKIAGTVTIAPFENNLSYYIVDAAGNELAAGPVPVTAPDMGAPGTFEAEVPLDHVAAGTRAWIEIRDLSAADGSLLAMDSVEVVKK